MGYHIVQILHLLGNPEVLTVSGATHQEVDMYEERRKDGNYDVEELGLGFVRLAGGISFFIEEAWAIHLSGTDGSKIVGSRGGLTLEPFTMMDSTGLLLNNQNPDIGQRHYIKQGTVLIDLTTLDADTLIAPRETGRKLFSIATKDSLQLYADFDDFINALTLALDGATTARSMYARGKYDADSNVFTAYKIGVYFLEP